jgi:UTP:GlnB (protein PII) uridylyltransferase
VSLGFEEEVGVGTVVQLFEEHLSVSVVANHLDFSQHGLILSLDHGLHVQQLAIL